jgi:hypothetical protein
MPEHEAAESARDVAALARRLRFLFAGLTKAFEMTLG